MTIGNAVDQVLERAVAAGEVPGVVALVAGDPGIIYQGAFGKREVGSEPAMTPDTVFRIASMTKAVTSVAAMQLVEQGKLDLDEPLGGRIPELASPLVLEGFDAEGAPRLRRARRPITLRLLLSHTAGFTYDMWNADMARYMEQNGIPSLGECKNISLRVPLVFDPGERWEYGINVDWAGKAVEMASGRLLDEYLRENVFRPLDMNDTCFVPGPDQQARLAATHFRNADGSLTPIPYAPPKDPEFFMGGGGLLSTGPDYLNFLQMLLHEGRLNDARILQAETVASMARNQIGDLAVGAFTSVKPAISNDGEFFPGMAKKWGLGTMIVTEAAPTGRSAGSLSWCGLINTYYWLDPSKRLTGVILTQILPFMDARALALAEQFERTVYRYAVGAGAETGATAG